MKESYNSEHDSPTFWAIEGDCRAKIMTNSFMKEKNRFTYGEG
jgi:hypothetical protein